MPEKMIPIGIENFEKLRKEGFYYVDKTGLIKDLLLHWGEVNLFTRPRRFGKTLNMSMLRCFFEPGGDPQIFDGLEISKERKLCDKYMGKYPVISISLKSMDAGCYETALAMAVMIVYASDGDLEKGCRQALEQIEKNSYAKQLTDDGVQTVLKYGVACFKKRCRVRVAAGKADAGYL